jgi:hypothetical protein
VAKHTTLTIFEPAQNAKTKENVSS